MARAPGAKGKGREHPKTYPQSKGPERRGDWSTDRARSHSRGSGASPLPADDRLLPLLRPPNRGDALPPVPERLLLRLCLGCGAATAPFFGRAKDHAFGRREGEGGTRTPTYMA